MANFITLPTVTPAGNGQLGQVLLGAAADYAAEKRRTENENRLRGYTLEDAARRRSEQLADVSSARGYEQKVFDRDRAAKIADIEAEKVFAAKVEMMRLGYLPREQFDDPAAVNAALQKFHNDGLLTKYQGALQSGDLSYVDLEHGDVSKIDAGLAAYSARMAKETTRHGVAIEGGTAQAADVQRRLRDLEGKEGQLTNQIRTLGSQAMTPPSKRELDTKAFELAAAGAKNPGKPTDKEIADARSAAEAALRTERQERVYAQIQSLKDEVLLNRQMRQSLTSQADTLANKGMFAPAASFSAAPATPLTDTISSPGMDAAGADAARAATRSKLLGTPAPNPVSAPPPPPTAPSVDAVFGTLENAGIFSRPITQQGRLRAYAQTTPDLLQSARTAVEGEISRLQTMPANRAAPGRLKMLSGALQDLDRLQRAQDQQGTKDAQMLQEPPESDSNETRPRTGFYMPTDPFTDPSPAAQWWALPAQMAG